MDAKVQYSEINYFFTANGILDKKGLEEITCIKELER